MFVSSIVKIPNVLLKHNENLPTQKYTFYVVIKDHWK